MAVHGRDARGRTYHRGATVILNDKYILLSARQIEKAARLNLIDTVKVVRGHRVMIFWTNTLFYGRIVVQQETLGM